MEQILGAVRIFKKAASLTYLRIFFISYRCLGFISRSKLKRFLVDLLK